MSSTIGFSNEEMAVMSLSRLYKQYGFKQFKMNKFEEYDLYAKNKDFLLSSNVITFTDTNGKLMALKPDVTLSVIKNSSDTFTEPEKVYYSENVYRVDKGTHQFREIMQIGLECIGDIDTYCVSEVILLAQKSLEAISPDNILDISHMGFIEGIFDEMKPASEQKNQIVTCISEKNILAVNELAKEYGFSPKAAEALAVITELYGPFKENIGKLEAVSFNDKMERAVSELRDIYSFLKEYGCGGKLNLDFSIVNDLNYYDGVIFQGFIDGVPSRVLTGERYDKLVHKFGKKSGAVGFAVYLDQLSQLMFGAEEYDVDVLLLYDGGTDLQTLAKAVKELTESGKSVKTQKRNSGAIKYRQLMGLSNGEVQILETDD